MLSRFYPYVSAKGLAVLGLGCASLVAADAHAAIKCPADSWYPTFRISSPWASTVPPERWQAAPGTEVTAMAVDATYVVVMTSVGVAERVAVRAHWEDSSQWVPATNAMKFMENEGSAKGFGLQVRIKDSFVQPGTPTAGTIFTHAGPGNETHRNLVAQRLFFIVTRAVNDTRGGPFGAFGGTLHWGADEVSYTNTWKPALDCKRHSINSLAQLGAEIGAPGGEPPPPPPPQIVCTVNNGLDLSYPLPEVAVQTMDRIGAQPISYPKKELSIGYACTGTATNDPAFTMALVGQRAGTTDALASSRPGVGVMVEAVDSLTGISKVMRPDPAEASAEKVRIHNAGMAGGSSLKIQAYPVRSHAGTIDAGSFTATGTLKIFTQ